MEPVGMVRKAVWAIGLCAVTLGLCGCPAEKQPGKPAEKPAKPATSTSATESKPQVKPAPPAPASEPEKAATEKKVTEKATAEKAATEKKAAPAAQAQEKSPAVAAGTASVVKNTSVEKKETPVAKPAATPSTTSSAMPNGAASNAASDDGARKPKDLGAPLVDDPSSLKKLDPVQPVWIDAKHKQVIFLAESCQAEYPLEFFATLRDRGYESVVVMDVQPMIIHAALLSVGAKPGSPVKFEPSYSPPTGTEIAIEVRWKDKAGKVQRLPAQQWIREIKTKKAMAVNWVFAGSGFRKDPETGKDHYLGDSGDFIAVLNLPTATLDIPIPSTSALESRSYEGFVDHMPPQGTPVTVVLTPK